MKKRINPMKHYHLILHRGQGDDLGEHLAKSKTVADAFRLWGADLRACADICERIAYGVRGRLVEVNGEGDGISLWPEGQTKTNLGDAQAGEALDVLVKERVLMCLESWNDEAGNGIYEEDDDPRPFYKRE